MTTLDRDYMLPLMLELHQTRGNAWFIVMFHTAYWKMTRNPFHMDEALVCLTKAGGTVGPVMQAVLAEVAEARLNQSADILSTLRGRPETVKRDIAKHAASMFMSFAVFLKGDRSRAALGASALHAYFDAGKNLKASTLEKYLERIERERPAETYIYPLFEEYTKHLKAIDGDLWEKRFLDLLDLLVESGLGEAGVRRR